jgi:D-tyrosyl-tRNA(Tyr) deacylase
MRTVIQRASSASVSVDGKTIAEIGSGLVILVGVGHEDTKAQAKEIAEKIAYLRIFEDANGKTNRSILDIGGEALVISQFTLYADTMRGRRPSFTKAAPPELAASLVDQFSSYLEQLGVPVRTGEFGAHMEVALVNDGPMTITLER